MAYNTFKHGRAEYGQYMQVPDALVVAEGTDSVALSAQRFAQYVYAVDSGSAESAIQTAYSKFVAASAGYTYTMYAAPGSLSGDPVWRINRTDVSGSRMWPSGDASFSYPASGYTEFDYTF